MWFGVGAVVGSGIFTLTGLEARDHAGPAIILSYVVSGFSAMLSVFCYTEFAVEIPVAGTYVCFFLKTKWKFLDKLTYITSISDTIINCK